MPAPSTLAFQQQAFQDDAPPTDAFESDAFQPGAFQFQVAGVGAIQSAEAFGTPAVSPVSTGNAQSKAWPLWRKIPSRFRRGQSSTVFALSDDVAPPAGRNITAVARIASAEAFGTPIVSLLANAPASVEARSRAWPLWRKIPSRRRDGVHAPVFAAPDAASSTQTVSGVGAIASAEAFGASTRLRRILALLGISSGEALGTPTKNPQIVVVGGISSAESFGVAQVSGGTIVLPTGGSGGGPGGVIAPAAREGRQVIVTLLAGSRQVVLFDKRV